MKLKYFMTGITLSTPQIITIQPAKTKTITELTINRVVDLPGQKIVRAFIQELDAPVVLWQGAAYDAVGQWTDSDVTARLNALYNSGTASNG